MISVVITTYGEDSWTELAWTRAYPSVADQTSTGDEIIVHHEPLMQIGPARNTAALRAKGEWLIFLDADDELAPGYIGSMKSAAKGKHVKPLFQPSVQYVRKGRAAPPVLIPEKDLRHDNYLVIGTMLRRALFNKVRGFNNYPHGFEDWSVWAKCWKQGARVVPVAEAIYVAHINQHSAHRQLWRDRPAQVALHLKVQKELFPEGVT